MRCCIPCQLLVENLLTIRPITHYSLRPRQNGCHFADDIFKCIFLNENVRISIKISLNFVPKGSINNIPSLVQIMAWGRPGDKPLSEPMMVSLLTHICVNRPQWVKARKQRMWKSQYKANTIMNWVQLYHSHICHYGDERHTVVYYRLMLNCCKYIPMKRTTMAKWNLPYTYI